MIDVDQILYADLDFSDALINDQEISSGIDDFVLPPNGLGGYLAGVNNLNQFVGAFTISPTQNGGFVDTDGNFQILSPGFAASLDASAINDAGAVAGTYWTAGSSVPNGFYEFQGYYLTVDDPLGVLGTEVAGVNSALEMAGTYWDANNQTHGFSYINGVFADIDDPLGETEVAGVNNGGDIVGNFYDANGVAHGFVYRGGVFTTVDDPEATGGTYLTGINDEGQIVGDYVNGSGRHSFTATLPESQRALFAARDVDGTYGLWVTDGTASGTYDLTSPKTNPHAPTGLTGLQDLTVFGSEGLFAGQSADGGNLWVTNGAIGGTREIAVAGASTYGLNPQDLTAFNGEVLFSGQGDPSAGGQGSGLWVTDGTSAGTHALLVAGVGAYGLMPSSMTVFNGEVLFSGESANGGYGLWVTNGTGAGTYRLDVAGSSIDEFNPYDFTRFGDEILFRGIDASGFDGLWLTDGTAAGTHEVTGIAGAEDTGLYLTYLTPFDDEVLFAGETASGGYGLWKTDGTAQGTLQIPVAGSDPSESTNLDPSDLTVLNGQVLFAGFDANGEKNLWVTNGTTAGTHELAVAGADPDIGLYPSDLTVVNGQILFSGLNAAGNIGLWVTDGTAAGTHEVSGIANAYVFSGLGLGGFNPYDITSFPLLAQVPAPVFNDPSDPTWRIVASADFTGDGLTDYVWRNADGHTEIWDAEATGGYNKEDFGVVDNSWQVVGTGDVTGDGHPDLLWKNAGDDELAWYANSSGAYATLDVGVVSNAPLLGGGGTTPVFDDPSDPTWAIVASADFTGDGLTDYVWRNSVGHTEIWNALPHGGYASQDFGVVDNAWQVVGTADVTGDGHSDILWENAGHEIAWYANSAGNYSSLDLGPVGNPHS